MTDRAAAWCSECMSDSHDYPNCPQGEGAPTPDLATQIRNRLDVLDKESVSASSYGDVESPLAALRAVLDACAPDALPPNGCGCDGDLKLWVMTVIADKLGIEAAQ